MGDVVIACPLTGRPVKTGWVMPRAVLAQSIVFDAVLDPCPACGQRHPWARAEAWVVESWAAGSFQSRPALAQSRRRATLRTLADWLWGGPGNPAS